MALPSGVTYASVAVMTAAGIGLVATQLVGAPDSTAATPPPSQATVAPTPTATPTEPTQAEHSRPKILIEVYNNTGPTGAAEQAAAKLKRQGWDVAATDNWHGSIPESTVYHPRGRNDAARELAKSLGYDRVRLAVSPMSGSRLTVIIVGD